MCNPVWTSKTRISNKILPRDRLLAYFQIQKQKNTYTHVLGVHSSSQISKQGQTSKKTEGCPPRFPPDPLRDWTIHQGKWRNTAIGWRDLSKVSFFFGKQRRVGEAELRENKTGEMSRELAADQRQLRRLRRWAPDTSVNLSSSRRHRLELQERTEMLPVPRDWSLWGLGHLSINKLLYAQGTITVCVMLIHEKCHRIRCAYLGIP